MVHGLERSRGFGKAMHKWPRNGLGSYSQRRRDIFPETNNPNTNVVWNYFFLMEPSRMSLGWPTRLDFSFAWKLWEKLMFQH